MAIKPKNGGWIMEPDSLIKGSMDKRLLIPLALVLGNIALLVWQVSEVNRAADLVRLASENAAAHATEANRYQAKMNIADKIMAVQRERTARYLSSKDCGRLLATLDTAAMLVTADVPSSMTLDERLGAFRDALMSATEKQP